jgi:hypothetical protein
MSSPDLSSVCLSCLLGRRAEEDQESQTIHPTTFSSLQAFGGNLVVVTNCKAMASINGEAFSFKLCLPQGM